MYIDAQLLFSDAQAITAAAGSTNTIDLGVVGGRDLGTGTSIYVVVTIDVALSGANVTLVVALEGDSTTSFSPDATAQLGIIPAETAAGKVFIFKLDPVSDMGTSSPLSYQYIRLKFTPTGGAGTLSTGSVTAFITLNPQSVKNFADAITIAS